MILRVAVVGTSNAIMVNGWAKSLKAIAPSNWEIENMSLGASPSLYGSYIVSAREVAGNFDVAILDFTTNDQQFLDIRNLTPEYMAGSYAGLLRHFAGAKCAPLALFMPQKKYVETGDGDKAYRLSRAICEKYGVSTLDFFLTLRGIARAGVSANEIFSDWAHLHVHYQAMVAEALVRRITNGDLTTPGDDVLRDAPCLSAVPAIDVEYTEAEERAFATSMVNHNVSTIRAGGGGSIRNAPYLLAVLHWIEDASGPVCFAGKRMVMKSFRKAWHRRFGFTHFRAPLAGRDEIRFAFGEHAGYLFESGFGHVANRPLAGDQADIVGFLKSDADPCVAGHALIN
jgi:hypothetical protein